jgi:hypothetical protein
VSGTHPQVQATVNQEAGVSDVASGECGCRCHHVVHEFELFLLVSLMISVVSGTPPHSESARGWGFRCGLPDAW